MIRLSRLPLLIISLIVVLAVACTPAPANQNLAGTHWKLTALNSQAPVTAGNQITLNFDPNNRISGNSGCNSYGGDYAVNGSALTIGEMLSTLMACADQSVNDQEAVYDQAMGSVASFEITNGQLNLKDAGGKVILIFNKV